MIDATKSFAAELLMPADEVVEFVSESGLDVNDDQAVRRLARRFGVSQQAMTYRIVNLGAELDGTARFERRGDARPWYSNRWDAVRYLLGYQLGAAFAWRM